MNNEYHPTLNEFERYLMPRIIVSASALKETTEPVRVHVKKRWMRDRYHERVQKKWSKRFGFVMRPVAIKTPLGIIIHPSLKNHLLRAMANN